MIYIYMVIIIMAIGILFKVNKNKARKKFFIFVSFGIMTLIAALRKSNIGIDLNILYTPYFYRISNLSFENLDIINFERGFTTFVKILTLVKSDIQIFTVITSLLSLGIIGYFIYKNSDDVITPTLLFVLSTTFYMSMNVIRQFLAIAIILIAYELMKKRKYSYYYILIILASTFHNASIIFLLLPLFNKLNINKISIFVFFTIIVLTYMFLPEIVTLSSNMIYKIVGETNKNYGSYLTGRYGTGTLNFFNISETIISFIMLTISYYSYSLKKARNKSIEETKILLILSSFYFMFTLLYIRMSVISRLGLFFIPFAFISFSNGINEMKNKRNKNVFTLIVITLMLARFTYITITRADALFGVTPYMFFWE